MTATESATAVAQQPTTSQRRIVASLFISLDGVVEAPEKWHFPYFDEEMGAVIDRMTAESDALLLGRATYEIFASTWPHESGEMADALNSMPKLVVSRTLTEAAWQNSTVIDGDLGTELTELKQRPGRDIYVTGSITLTRSLLRLGLLDDLHLLVHPIAVGSGQRLFAEGDRVPLRLASSATFATGVVHLHYQPA